MLPLLFPPFYFLFLAPVALVPFGWCAVRRPLSWKYLLGYYALGAAFFLPNLFWLIPVTWGGWLALSLFVALYFPLFAIAFNRLVVQLRMPATFALPIAWTAVEYLRSSFVMGGFPWFILGNCATPAPILVQIADLFGVWGITFLIAMLNGFFVDLLRMPLKEVVVTRGGSRQRFSKKIGRLIATVTVVLAATVSYGVIRLGQQTFRQGPLVTVVQENLSQRADDPPAARDEGFMKYLALTDTVLAQASKPDLIAWPETMVAAPINPEVLRGMPDMFQTREQLRQLLLAAEASTDPDAEYRRIDDVYEALVQEADRGGVPLLVGYGGWYPKTQSHSLQIRNNTLLMLPELAAAGSEPAMSEPRQEYSKIHLVPFGEYIPFHNTPIIGKLLLALTPADFDYSNTPGTQWTRFRLPVSRTWNEELQPPLPAPASAPAGSAPASASAPATSAPGTMEKPQREIFSDTRLYMFATPICFEDTMPEPARNMTAPQMPEAHGIKTDFLMNVSNDGWFSGFRDPWLNTFELDQHLQACQLRAVEERVPIARSVNTGNSGFIDSDGRIEKLVTDAQGRSIGAVGIASSVMLLDARITLYSRIGDLLPIVCGIVAAILVGWTFARPRLGARRGEVAESEDPAPG